MNGHDCEARQRAGYWQWREQGDLTRRVFVVRCNHCGVIVGTRPIPRPPKSSVCIP